MQALRCNNELYYDSMFSCGSYLANMQSRINVVLSPCYPWVGVLNPWGPSPVFVELDGGRYCSGRGTRALSSKPPYVYIRCMSVCMYVCLYPVFDHLLKRISCENCLTSCRRSPAQSQLMVSTTSKREAVGSTVRFKSYLHVYS